MAIDNARNSMESHDPNISLHLLASRYCGKDPLPHSAQDKAEVDADHMPFAIRVGSENISSQNITQMQQYLPMLHGDSIFV